MATRQQVKRDTAANWTSNNPILLAGEIGFETDTNKFKIGDGTTAWNSLAYILAGTYLGLHAKADNSAALNGHADTYFQIAGSYEVTTNKATTFGTINDTLYPTVKAVNDAIISAVVGLLDYRGSYDASTNLFPATGGSGLAGAILKGDFWIISVAGILGGNAVYVGDMVIALQDTPAQTAANWNIVEYGINYVPENAANKVTSISGASTDVQYPSAKLLYDQLLTKQVLGAVSDETDNYQIINTDFGSGIVFTLSNAGTKTFTLPSAANMAGYLGRIITLVKKGAGKVIIIGEAGQYIADSSSGGTIYNDQATETYATITLVAITTTQFVIVGMDGTWTVN